MKEDDNNTVPQTDIDAVDTERSRINSTGNVELFREGYWQPSWQIRDER